jgi:hypothetical protein
LPSWPASIIRPTASVGALLERYCSSFPSRATPASEEAGQLCLPRATENPEVPNSKRFLIYLSVSLLPSTCLLARRRALSGRQGQRGDPPHHASKQPPPQMALRQHPPVVTGMLLQPPTRLHQPLPQAGQGPALDLLWQHQPTLQVAKIVGDQAQPQPAPVATQSIMPISGRHFERFVCLDPGAGSVDPHCIAGLGSSCANLPSAQTTPALGAPPLLI